MAEERCEINPPCQMWSISRRGLPEIRGNARTDDVHINTSMMHSGQPVCPLGKKHTGGDAAHSNYTAAVGPKR